MTNALFKFTNYSFLKNSESMVSNKMQIFIIVESFCTNKYFAD